MKPKSNSEKNKNHVISTVTVTHLPHQISVIKIRHFSAHLDNCQGIARNKLGSITKLTFIHQQNISVVNVEYA